jgi:catechol 2,3-dioxygenase-like lactoylglutathione lyase family enzyme
MTVEPRITFMTLGIADLPRAVQFYRDDLGWPPTYEAGWPIAFFNVSGTRLSLSPLDHLAADISPEVQPARTGFGGIALAHNFRTKIEVAEVFALAERAGGRIIKPSAGCFLGWAQRLFYRPRRLLLGGCLASVIKNQCGWFD